MKSRRYEVSKIKIIALPLCLSVFVTSCHVNVYALFRDHVDVYALLRDHVDVYALLRDHVDVLIFFRRYFFPIKKELGDGYGIINFKILY
jgi:hypothetical protein